MLLALRPSPSWQICLSFIWLAIVSKNTSPRKQHRWASYLQATYQWRITLCEIRWLSEHLARGCICVRALRFDRFFWDAIQTPPTSARSFVVQKYYLNYTSFCFLWRIVIISISIINCLYLASDFTSFQVHQSCVFVAALPRAVARCAKSSEYPEFLWRVILDADDTNRQVIQPKVRI
jgi:hypothetical protein